MLVARKLLTQIRRAVALDRHPMKLPPRFVLVGLAVTSWLAAGAPAEDAAPRAAEASAQAEAKDQAIQAQQKEQEALAAENKLQAERLTKETNAARAEITRLKLEREVLGERLALEAAKRQSAAKEEIAKLESERDKLAREGELAKVRAEKLSNDLKSVQAVAALDVARLQNDIALIEATEKRAQFADAKPASSCGNTSTTAFTARKT